MKPVKGEKRGVGRPATGKKERISINIDPENLAWLKKQTRSYSRIVNRLIEEAGNGR